MTAISQTLKGKICPRQSKKRPQTSQTKFSTSKATLVKKIQTPTTIKVKCKDTKQSIHPGAFSLTLNTVDSFISVRQKASG